MSIVSKFDEWNELNEGKKKKKKKKKSSKKKSSSGTKVYNNYYGRPFGGGFGYGLYSFGQHHHDNTPDITNNINIDNNIGGGDSGGGDAGGGE
jgi:hypothetical protein